MRSGWSMYSVYTRYMKIHVSTSKQHSHTVSWIRNCVTLISVHRFPLKTKVHFIICCIHRDQLYIWTSISSNTANAIKAMVYGSLKQTLYIFCSFFICFNHKMGFLVFLTIGILKKNVALLLAFLNHYHLQDRGGDGSNQIYLVTSTYGQLTQASFLQKNQMLQNVFLIFLKLR